MRTQKWVGAILMLLMIAAAGAAQTPAVTPVLKVKIDFEFVALDKTLPAGEYELSRDQYSKFFRVTDGKNSALIPILTRLANAGRTSMQDNFLVFDVVESKSFLSEIWFRNEDGYQVASTKEEHMHKVLPTKR